MYFPGDSLQLTDAIFSSIPAAARERLVSRFAPEKSISEFALGYEFDIVVRGGSATPFEEWREPVR
jgi:protocatechuate 3,4-dioxygenase beta subunit